MSHYREVLQCKQCGKIYRTSYFISLHAVHAYDNICGKCGAKNKIKYVTAKPILFGLKGWVVKGELSIAEPKLFGLKGWELKK